MSCSTRIFLPLGVSSIALCVAIHGILAHEGLVLTIRTRLRHESCVALPFPSLFTKSKVSRISAPGGGGRAGRPASQSLGFILEAPHSFLSFSSSLKHTQTSPTRNTFARGHHTQHAHQPKQASPKRTQPKQAPPERLTMSKSNTAPRRSRRIASQEPEEMGLCHAPLPLAHSPAPSQCPLYTMLRY